MTQEEFYKLPINQQEEFINSGGVFSLAEVPAVSPTINGDSDDTIPQPSVSTGRSVTPQPVVIKGQEGKETVASMNMEVSPPASAIYTEGFDILDPIELLFLLDDEIASGKVTLHDWQKQILLDFSNKNHTDTSPFQALVRACNGSGKDKYILAPCAVWLCMRYKSARCVITSSSGVQLDNQTCAYIDQLCLSANRKFGPIWKCNYRYYECLATESPMVCFATDESGKAEGYHPLKFGAKMAILVSEDKTVPDEINIALNKCTGYTHRMHVSTPGNAFGHFFDMCSTALERADIVDIKSVKPEDFIHYKVVGAIVGPKGDLSQGDCSHLSISYAKQMARDLPGGIHGAAFKSQVLAEFGTTDEMVVIPYTYIWRAKNKKIESWVQEDHNKAGLDLSDGGDETVLIVRNGNRVLNVIPFRFDNTEDTIAFLNEKFREHKLTHRESLIFADCGGIGKPMLDRMRRQGWSNIRYVDNRSKTSRPKTFKNYGAESWFHLGDLLKQNEIILIDDPKLIKQLSTRYYKIIDGAIHQLLSKIEMRSRGYPSPDRADACVLAFSDYKSTFSSSFDSDERKPELEGEEKVSKPVSQFVLKSIGDVRDMKTAWNVNSGQKDFDYLKEEIAEYNRNLVLNKK